METHPLVPHGRGLRLPIAQMRRALMAGFGNARLAGRDEIQSADLPRASAGKPRVGFIQ